MKNQYFADVGDFGKYGFLRLLAGETARDNDVRLSLGVVWYLTPDDRNSRDGRHRSYIEKPDEYKVCDPFLFDELKRANEAEAMGRNVSSTGHIFPSGTRVWDAELKIEDRASWLAGARRASELADLIFLDPDNGLEVPSVPVSSIGAPKYVYLDDLKYFVSEETTTVIYQHLPRLPHDREITRRLQQLKSRLPQRPSPLGVRFRRGTARVFLVLPAAKHESLIESRLNELLGSEWCQRKHFDGRLYTLNL
jgi:hypothetical protein